MKAGQMAIADQVAEHHSIEGSLRTLLAIEEARPGNKCLSQKLLSLENKLASGQLHLAILGQMKRGKSTFINALLGAEVLPTGVLPVTAIITEIKYGSVPDAVIVYSTGDLQKWVGLSALGDYITEAGNPGNKKQVASVEIAYPSPFLEGGIVLIDTPGIGSTHAHNTRTTENYLKQVDAGIVVLSVDPPITDVEFQFLRSLKEDIPKLFFILNKTDIASNDEIGKVAQFLESELGRLEIKLPEIFPLSARQALEEKRHASSHSATSGVETFEKRLREFLSQEKGQVLVRSVAMDALRLARTLKFATSIGVRAGQMTTEVLEGKRQEMDRLLERTELEMRELQVLLRQHSADILAGVERDLTAHVETYVSEVRQHLKRFQMDHPKETGHAFATLLEGFLMKEIGMVFERWRIQEDDKIQAQLDALSSRFVTHANNILKRLEQIAGTLFETPVEHLAIRCPLQVESHLSYRVERVFYSLDSFLLVLPRILLRPIVFRKIQSNIPLLLGMNAGRIRYDYVERLQSSMIQFEKDIHGAVSMVIDTLKFAFYIPRGNQSGQQEVMDRLDTVISDCARLLM